LLEANKPITSMCGKPVADPAIHGSLTCFFPERDDSGLVAVRTLDNDGNPLF